MTVDITMNTRQINEALQRLSRIPNALQLVVHPAIDESVKGAKSILANYLSSDVPLPSRITKKALRLESISSSGGGTTATLRVRSARVPLIHYDVQPAVVTSAAGTSPQNRPDFSYSLRRGERRQGRDLERHGNTPFIAKMRSGHLGVFYRNASGIKEIYGPSVQYHVATPEVTNMFEDEVNQRFPAILSAYVDRVLAEHGGPS